MEPIPSDRGKAVRPEVEKLLREPMVLDQWLDQVPFMDTLKPYQDQVVTGLGEATQRIGRFLIDNLAAATAGTAMFLCPAERRKKVMT